MYFCVIRQESEWTKKNFTADEKWQALLNSLIMKTIQNVDSLHLKENI